MNKAHSTKGTHIMSNEYKAEACPEVGFTCAKCGEFNSGHTDCLKYGGEHVDGIQP